LIAAAALSFASTAAGGLAARNSAIRSANQATRAEGEAIRDERVNTMVSNSYSAAFGQMQLALEKRRAAGNTADVRAQELFLQGEQTATAAAQGSFGASVQAVQSDIAARADRAEAEIDANLESQVEEYNNMLNSMVVNTRTSAPNVRRAEYKGPSTGQVIFGSLLQTAVDFGGQYAMSKAKLGLGK
jgi:hypothetical protein